MTPTLQLGDASVPIGVIRPGYWAGTSQSWSSLGGSGTIRAISGDQWVGNADGHAVIWEGLSHTRIDMHAPPGYEPSVLYATTGVWQAGIAAELANSRLRAAVWHGTPDSAQLLHPVGAYESVAQAADGDRQGGWVTFPNQFGAAGPQHAAVWSGSAQTMIDLNPPGAHDSVIMGMAAGQLVGGVGTASEGQAALWTSVGQPYINLNPPGIRYATAYATCGSAQVGLASTNEFGATAVIWFGTAESFTPLNSYLPASYYGAVATSVAEGNGVFYVGGYAYNSVTSAQEAFLWVGVPAPASLWIVAMPLLARRPRRSYRR